MRSTRTLSVEFKPSGSLLTPNTITRYLVLISPSENYKKIKYSNCSSKFLN